LGGKFGFQVAVVSGIETPLHHRPVLDPEMAAKCAHDARVRAARKIERRKFPRPIMKREFLDPRRAQGPETRAPGIEQGAVDIEEQQVHRRRSDHSSSPRVP